MLLLWNFRLLYCSFFFFKQKTAYEMRISDWSSDVCSSDLAARRPLDFGHQQIAEQLWNIDRIYLGVGGRKPLAAQPIPIAVGVVQPLVVDLLQKAFCRDRVGAEIA